MQPSFTYTYEDYANENNNGHLFKYSIAGILQWSIFIKSSQIEHVFSASPDFVKDKENVICISTTEAQIEIHYRCNDSAKPILENENMDSFTTFDIQTFGTYTKQTAYSSECFEHLRQFLQDLADTGKIEDINFFMQ